VYFVYRSHYDGPLSKRVRRLPDASVLDWFRRGWECESPEDWVAAELGGDVYGLESIFEEAREHDISAPESTDELRSLLRKHLYVEGGDDYIRLDDHSLRVRTDDDEVELAYFFLDDDIVARAPQRLAYLLHESWPLPHAAGPSPGFRPEIRLTPVDEVAVYAVFLTFHDGESLDCPAPVVLPGAGLPALAATLRSAAVGDDSWPPELRLLQAAVGPGEDSILPGLKRCNNWPGFNLDAEPWPDRLDEEDDVRSAFTEMLGQARYTDDRRPDASLIRVDEHFAQVAMHCSESFGYQQWYLFDSVWAASHPHLANSLLRYAVSWDPLSER